MKTLPKSFPSIKHSSESPFKKFRKLKELGKGTYGQVFRVQDKITGEIFALKRIFQEKQPQGLPQTTLREISALQQMNHANIIKLLEIFYNIDDGEIYLLFENMDTDLHKFLKKKVLTLEQIKFIFKQIVEGLNYCHYLHIIHRDLKPKNILINKNTLKIKIADFGLARNFNLPYRPYSYEISTINYKAPEILLQSQNYGVGIDIWSLGCILAELFTGQVIFKGLTENELLMSILSQTGFNKNENLNHVKNINIKSLIGEGFRGLYQVETFNDDAWDLIKYANILH